MFANRLKSVPLAVALATTIGLLGCDARLDEVISDAVGMASIRVDKMTLRHPVSFGDRNVKTENNVTTVDWTQSNHVVRLQRGKFTLNGNVHGLITKEQVVTVEEDGTATIDGEDWPALKPCNVTFHGVRFELEGQTHTVTHEDGADRFVDMIGRQCELRNGQFSVDGVSFGTLQEGDVVSVSIDRSIVVNGSRREPQ